MSERQEKTKMQAFVLAGGRSKRFGSNKALYRLGDKTLIEHTCGRLSSLFGRVRILARDSCPLGDPGFEILPDLREEACPLSGIYSGLKYLGEGKAFFLACDLPLARIRLLKYILKLSTGFDAVVPHTGKGLEPLCAVYDASCTDAVESAFSSGNLKADSFLGDVRTKIVEKKELTRYDPDLITFSNVNTPADAGSVLEILSREKANECS